MNDIQRKLMELMDEIDTLCREKDLHYVLFGQTAAQARKESSFVGSTYEFQIIMPLPDILRLQTLVNESLNSTRTFESWEDNAALPQMVFRYTDRNSLLVDGWTGAYHTKPGIAITIFTAKTERPSAKILGCERYLQMYNDGRSKYFWATITFAKVLRKIVGKARTEKILHVDNLSNFTSNTGKLQTGGLRALLHGRKKLGQYIVENQADCPSYSNAKAFWFMRSDGKLTRLPKNLFRSCKRITFEKRKFPLPKKWQVFLSVIFGENWETTAYLPLPDSWRMQVINDSNMPYEDYLNSIKESRSSLSNIARYWAEYYYWMKTEHDPAKDIKEHAYGRVERSVNRIDIWYTLRSKRDTIRTAYQTDDIGQLRFVLEEYLQKTEEYKNEGIGFYIDSELFDCAKLVWEADGKTGYADQVYALVPELYKNETVDEYLASRGVTVD